jgi:HNH endonuclease
MKQIPLTKGAHALVDDADFEQLSQHKWLLITPGGANGRRYAARYVGRKLVYMHRLLLADQLSPECPHADHRDGDGLNNSRANLRVCNRSQNQRNRGPQPRTDRTSQFKGVSFRKGNWLARINTTPGIQTHIGSFGTELEAALAYDAAAIVYHGQFARLNFPSGIGSVAP